MLDCDPSGIGWGQTIFESQIVGGQRGARAEVAGSDHDLGVAPPGSGRNAATPASSTSPPAVIRRASTVRDQSGRSHCEIRLGSEGFSDVEDSPTPQP